MRILAIETSCDETAVAVLEIKENLPAGGPRFRILSNIVSSQIKIHAKWGGVVPTLAKREHQKNLVRVLTKALKEAKLLKNQKSPLRTERIQTISKIMKREDVLLKKLLSFLKKYETPKIDAIAITQGPGLEPALWVGINFAKALAYAWGKPIIPVNHMEGHLFSAFLKSGEKMDKQEIPILEFPVLALLVSGGHTEIVLVKDWLKYKLLGQTRDDAAGEAFDKAAKMLGLGYPGGPAIAAAAAKFSISNPSTGGQFPKINLPRPMISSKDFDFSFSGLKTSLLYKLKEFPKITEEIKIASAHEFQNAVVEVLIAKTLRAAKEYKAKTIIIGGGVSANRELHKQFKEVVPKLYDRKNLVPSLISPKLLLPEMKFTGDNAAMIALAGYFRLNKKKRPAGKWQTLVAEGNLKIA